MRFVLMIEGQEGVSWDDWVALARACEEHGLEGLFRSDHYQSVFDVVRPRLARRLGDARRARRRDGTDPARARWSRRRPSGVRPCSRGWSRPPTTSPAGASSSGSARAGTSASTTRTAFRSPLSTSGWSILEEQLEIVHRQWTEEEFSFQGRHYRLERCRRGAEAAAASAPADRHGRQRRATRGARSRPAGPTSTTPRSRRWSSAASAGPRSRRRASARAGSRSRSR